MSATWRIEEDEWSFSVMHGVATMVGFPKQADREPACAAWREFVAQAAIGAWVQEHPWITFESPDGSERAEHVHSYRESALAAAGSLSEGPQPIVHVDECCESCGNPTLIVNTRGAGGGLAIPSLPEGVTACVCEGCPQVHVALSEGPQAP